ncbi:acetyltransferase [Algisphaera agarilytica]|uniref:Sugar O-acyltransferase (Sialic acid O-acetyltransferase NeuD family) n=1 Tax=Algisphaera agarilytica TaxID=1385975 RepID=A0A7X0LLP4_9BACT|nr:acetyltransferase [Algisphaera agarilytica]MBB6430846.1 sugar O-acyltransferase (sialic acid O-acetyltransferase NeuD family) [Algisphaera agarilytica]
MIQSANPTPPLVIVGAGDHGTVVADTAQVAGRQVLGHLDDDPSIPNLLAPDDPRLADAQFIVAIGDNATRLAILKRLRAEGRTFTNVIHPSAVISPGATLGESVYVGPLAVVNTHATLGDAVIINSGAVVEHHCTVGPAVHLAPKAALAGRVTVHERTLVGVGAKILPGVTLGQHCIVGAGAVAVTDIPDHTTAIGIPARPC